MKPVSLASVAALVCQALAIPKLNFPFNSQLPPVAQWGKEYSYEISPDTYSNDNAGSIIYSSPNLPSWLSLSGRTLSGTPDGISGDSSVTFTLVAKDSSGEASNDCTLVLTDSALPTYDPANLEHILKQSGPISNPNSAVLIPNEPFEINFPSDFFTDVGNVVGHYAVTGDHSPLPIWLNFDGGAGKFSGTAPIVNSDIAQAQEFSVIYIVSTINDFESAGAEFNLVLGANILTMNISTDTVNATVGHQFTYEVPLNEISLNGVPVTKANLSSAKATIPDNAQSWLSWNSDSFQLSGTPPESAAGEDYDVEIDIADKFNDAVSWDVSINVNSANNVTVFSESSLPPANATRGQFFEYDLGAYIINKNIELSLSGGVDWLHVNNDNLTLTGMVPKSFEKALINITATPELSKRDSYSQQRTSSSLSARLELYGTGPKISSSSSSMSNTRANSSSSSASSSSASSSSAISSGTNSRTSTTTSSRAATRSTSTSSSTAFPEVGKKKSSNNAVAIGCCVGIPVGLAAIAAVVLFFFCRRRRKQRDQQEDFPDEDPVEKSTQISSPRPTSKGMVMAPVFRTTSLSSGEHFEDAVQYPGELPGGDEKTLYGADKEKGDGDLTSDTTESSQGTRNAPWDSPKRASTLNFLAMDDRTNNNSNHHRPRLSDEETIANLNPQEDDLYEVPPQREEDDVVGDIPRESWRHTNTGERRWQDARLSHNSLASIAPTESPTVLLAQDEFADNMMQSQLLEQQLAEQVRSGLQHDQHPIVSATTNGIRQSTQETPMQGLQPGLRPGMQREYSSGVLHRVGSHSSSHYSESHRGSHALSDRIGEHYRSGSSTDSQNSHDMSDTSMASFRPYRDENGELHWREAGDMEPGPSARLNNGALDRKPSASKTPRGDQGEFVFV